MEITVKILDHWHEQTKAARQKYLELIRNQKVKHGKLKLEANPSLLKPAKLNILKDTSRKLFVCNTNRRWAPDGDDEMLMRVHHRAITWTTFKHESHMKLVNPGDIILMFAKQHGIVGIGEAKTKVKVIATGQPGRLRTDNSSSDEWQIPVHDWIVWCADLGDAYDWTMPNSSFHYLKHRDHQDLAAKTYEHFSSRAQ